MDKYRENFGNGGEFVDNNDYSKEIAGEFEGRTEEEIVVEAKKGNVRAQEYVISKYEGFVKAKSKSYFLIGADKEDIYQEGMIGLYKAIRDFNYENTEIHNHSWPMLTVHRPQRKRSYRCKNLYQSRSWRF